MQQNEIGDSISESAINKFRAGPPSGEITMTSYPVGNKTSLSRKPCIADKRLLWNVMRKSWSHFQEPSCKTSWSAPWRRNNDDVISGLESNLVLSRKPCIPHKKLPWNAIRKSWSLSLNPSWKIARSAPWRRNDDDVISGLQQNLLISETVHCRTKVTKDHYQEFMLALSESIMKIAWSAPWRRTDDCVISGQQYGLVISETMHGSWKVTIWITILKYWFVLISIKTPKY